MNQPVAITAGGISYSGSETVTFPAVSGWLPLRVSRIWATGTTASGIVAVW